MAQLCVKCFPHRYFLHFGVQYIFIFFKELSHFDAIML